MKQLQLCVLLLLALLGCHICEAKRGRVHRRLRGLEQELIEEEARTEMFAQLDPSPRSGLCYPLPRVVQFTEHAGQFGVNKAMSDIPDDLECGWVIRPSVAKSVCMLIVIPNFVGTVKPLSSYVRAYSFQPSFARYGFEHIPSKGNRYMTRINAESVNSTHHYFAAPKGGLAVRFRKPSANSNIKTVDWQASFSAIVFTEATTCAPPLGPGVISGGEIRMRKPQPQVPPYGGSDMYTRNLTIVDTSNTTVSISAATNSSTITPLKNPPAVTPAPVVATPVVTPAPVVATPVVTPAPVVATPAVTPAPVATPAAPAVVTPAPVATPAATATH